MNTNGIKSEHSFDDFDENHDNDFYDDDRMDINDGDDSQEDTEEASETDYGNSTNYHRNNNEPIEIKEQMYQDKLSNLKKQLNELKFGTHPEFVRRVKKLESQYKERNRLNEIYREYLSECVERDYILEKKAAVKEYEEKKADLKENLVTDFEDKRKMIESERHTMELTGDSLEAQVKPTITRKLRRRPNDPLPVVESKRRKPTNGQLVLLLEEKDIDNDLKLISRGKALITPIRAPTVSSSNIGLISNNPNSSSAFANQENNPPVEIKIEDGKLLYERRWFHRGQPVFVEGKDIPRFPGIISGISNEIVCVKKITDSVKVRIYTAQLSRGKVSIKRRAS